jgi:hypothetical protein
MKLFLIKDLLLLYSSTKFHRLCLYAGVRWRTMPITVTDDDKMKIKMDGREKEKVK